MGSHLLSTLLTVIPEYRLTDATQNLTQFGHLVLCPDPEVCTSSSRQRPTPPPAFHMHIPGSEVTVGLYLQSETLWFLPALDDSLLSPQTIDPSSPFVLASDQAILPPWRPGRGSGVFPPGRNPVVAPHTHVMLEAFLRMYARDVGKRVGSFSMAMIAYVEEYIDDDGLLDVGQLSEPLRTSYRELRRGDIPVRRWTLDLKEALGLPVVLDD